MSNKNSGSKIKGFFSQLKDSFSSGIKANRKKSKAKVVASVLSIVLLSSLMLGLTVNLFKPSSGSNAFKESVRTLDSNVSLYRKSPGAYVKRIDNYNYVAVNSASKGDYISVTPASAFDFGAFFASNHDTVIFNFKITGEENYSLPTMSIMPIFEGQTDDFLPYAALDLTYVSDSSFGAVAAPGTMDEEMLGTFESAGEHSVSFYFSKVEDNDSVIYVGVRIDGTSFASHLCNIDSTDFKLDGFKINLHPHDGNKKNMSLVRVHDYSLEYIPSLTEFPADEIIIPEGQEVVYSHVLGSPAMTIVKSSSEASRTFSGASEAMGAFNYAYLDNESISAYINYDLKNSSNQYITILDYDYIKIEFDIFNPCQSGSEIVTSFNSNLIARAQVGGSAYTLTGATIKYVGDEENTLYALNANKTYMCVPAEVVHVEYLIEVNKDDITESVLQIYFNGELRYDSVSAGVKVFDSRATFLSDLRFGTFEGQTYFALDNLEFKCYSGD